ncbi:MAG: ABC transporter permease [bacterium]
MATLPLSAMTRLAWRNLWRNHRRTAIMLSAIVVGVWAMIFMTALMRGMVDDMIQDGIDALPGLVQVHHQNYRDDPGINNSMPAPGEPLLSALSQPEVAGWTTRVRVPAMISSERDSRGVVLLGVDPTGEITLGFDADSIIEGRFLEGDDDRGLVIGNKLLQRLETRLGKRVVIMSQDPDNNVADRGFRIVGVYKATLESREEQFVYAGRSVVQQMLGMDALISELAITGADYRQVDPLKTVVEAAVREPLEVQSWTELDTYLGSMMVMMDGFVVIWLVVIFLALSFGLVNTLMMAVFERIREIGLMQALGMRPRSILYLVLMESLLMLLLALLIGNLLAYVSIKPLEGGIDLSIVAKGMEMMGVGSVLYPALKLQDVIMANVVVIVLGLLTSLIPAWRASRYQPVEAIAKT